MSDVIEELVAGLDLRSSLYFRAELSAPFSLAVPADRRRIRFHVAGPGCSWIGLASGESAWVRHGDLILIPHGAAHILASQQAEKATPLGALTAGPEGGVLRYGGNGPAAELVCGHFEFDETAIHPLVDSLPPLIHVKAGSGSSAAPSFGWMPPLLQALESEAASGIAVKRRLSEILFIQVLRTVTTHGGVETGVLGLIADPQLGRALQAIHSEPGTDWSLDALASIAGASRSVFAERFRRHAGTTPMRYLADWRIRKARGLLTDPALSVADVGRRVGYASEAAFSRAFRSAVGEAPGRHRRALLQGGA